MKYDYFIPTKGIERLVNKEGIPCYSIPMNYFVQFVRAHNYPKMNCSTMQYEDMPFYGICTEEFPSDRFGTYHEWVHRLKSNDRMYFWCDDNAPVDHFEGVDYVQSDRTFKCHVDGHLYFLTFEEL